MITEKKDKIHFKDVLEDAKNLASHLNFLMREESRENNLNDDEYELLEDAYYFAELGKERLEKLKDLSI